MLFILRLNLVEKYLLNILQLSVKMCTKHPSRFSHSHRLTLELLELLEKKLFFLREPNCLCLCLGFYGECLCCAIALRSNRVFNLVILSFEVLLRFSQFISSRSSFSFLVHQKTEFRQFIYLRCLSTHISLLIIFKYLFIFHLTLIEGER